MSAAAIAVCAVLLCLCAGLALSMRKNRNNPDGVYAKALFRVRSARVIPVLALAYAFFAFAVLFFGLAAADALSGRERYLRENLTGIMMAFEKFNTGLEYPLMAIKGRAEISEEHPKILVVGDSFVWGEGLTNTNQIWWRIMATELERRGYDCQVIAAGYCGAATVDELDWLENTSILEDIKPDLILLGYVTNDDFVDPDYHIYRPSYLGLVESHTRKLNEHLRPDVAFPNLYNIIVEKNIRVGALKGDGYTTAPIEGRDWDYYKENALRPLGAFARELGIPLALIMTPEAPREIFGDLYRVLFPLFEEAGLVAYSPLDEFMKRYPNPGYRYLRASRVNTHPGPATSWFLGKYAADVVEQNYASILGDKRTQEKAYQIEINDWLPYMLDPRALQESDHVSRYVIEYPDQSSRPDYENYAHGNFLTLPVNKKYVKLNFKNPVRLSCVKIEGEDLLSCEVWTLGVNEKLGFDDQKPVRLGRRKGGACVWGDKGKRDVTSLLISAKTAGCKQASLTVTIEGEVNP